MGSGVGDYYFSGGFGFIDSPSPWPARSSAAAGDFEVSYTPAPLLAESSQAYFVFDYSPHDGGLLRVMEKRLAEGHGSGFAEGHAPELLQVGDIGEGSAILYARASSCSISGSSSSSTASGSSSGDDNGDGKGRIISEEQVRLQEGSVVQRLESKPHEEGGGPLLCCKQLVEYPSLVSSNIVLFQDQQHDHEEWPGISASSPNTVCLHAPPASASCPPPPPPPIIYSSFSSAWVDLDSPDSFVNLQDIDDTWLDSLPPLNTTTSCSPSPSTLRRPAAPAALMLPTNWGKLDSSSNVLPPPPPPPSFQAANKAADSPAPPTRPALIIPQPVVGAAPPAKQLQTAERPTRQEPSTAAPDRKRPKRLDLSEPKYVVLTRNYESVLKDGFKWRKYGQKSVKNNIYPRSYYKCSYEGCYVHKHVERVALDPCLILTTYRGRHTH